jgi:hypothetical protein
VEAPLGIGEKRVSAVDKNVAFFQKRGDFGDYLINRFARFDHHHRFAWTLQCADEFLDCVGRRDFFSFAAGGHEFFGDRSSAIKNGDRKSFRFHVERKILAHHRQANQANIRLHRHDFEKLFF